MAPNPRRVHSSDEGEESSTAPAAPTTLAIFDLLPDIMVDSSQPPLHQPSPPDVGQSPQGTTSAPSAPALYDLLPDGMMEGSQPQPPPPAAVKAKLQSAGGVDTSTRLYDMLPFAMEDNSPPPLPIAQSSLATTAKGVTSLAASFKDITCHELSPNKLLIGSTAEKLPSSSFPLFDVPFRVPSTNGLTNYDPESKEGAVLSELLDTQADDSPSEQGLFVEGVDDVDEDNEVLPASSENADDDGDDDKVEDLKGLKWKLDFLRVELLRVARHCEVLSEEVGNIIRKADDM
ncbi:hypothetical protein BJY52DRAFT_1228588 [Lactarius psammicola]|nr:hypothetical protein BJY52DRAFT_1228588 [Lactarius psammicola]